MSLIKETIYYNIGNIVYLSSQWIISIVIARIGGFADAGIFALAMSVANIFSILAQYGMRTYQITDINKTYSDSEYILSRIYTIAISLILCVVYAVSTSNSITIILSIISYMLYKSCESYSDVLNGTWQRFDNTKKISFSLLIKGILNTATFLTVYIVTNKLVLSIFAMALSSLLIVVLYDNIVTHHFNSRIQIKAASKPKTLNLLRVCLITMLNSFAIAATASFPKIAIEKLMDEESLGYFSSISAPTVIISTVAVGIAIPLIPKASKYFLEKNTNALYKYLFGCLFFFIFLSIICELFAIALGEYFLNLLFGSTILEYSKLLYPLIIAASLTAILCCYSGTLIAYRNIKAAMIFSFLCAIILLPLLIILINNYGIYGAAYALIIAQTIQLIPETIYLFRTIHSFKKTDVQVS